MHTVLPGIVEAILCVAQIRDSRVDRGVQWVILRANGLNLCHGTREEQKNACEVRRTMQNIGNILRFL